MLVCCGPGCCAAFQGCEFHECPLYAVHGAATTLRGCTLRGCIPAAVAHGPGTTLHLDTCTLADCATDITGEDGASVSAVQCHSKPCHTAIISRDAGTSVSCDRCTFGVSAASGILAHGSRVHLRHCALEGFCQSIYATGRAMSLELHGCHVSVTTCAVTAVSGAVVQLRETHLRVRSVPHAGMMGAAGDSLAPAFAMLVSVFGSEERGPAGAVRIERCSLGGPGRQHVGVAVRQGGSVAMVLSHLACGHDGVSVTDSGGALVLHHCAVQSGHATACSARAMGCSVRIKGGLVSGGECAASAENGGSLAVSAATLRGLTNGRSSATCVIAVRDRATARLACCSLTNAFYGVLATEANVYATDVNVFDMAVCEDRVDRDRRSAGYMQLGGSLSVARGSVTGCYVGVRMRSRSDGIGAEAGDARIEGVSFWGNGVGVQLDEHARCEIAVSGCDFKGGKVKSSPKRVLALGGKGQIGVHMPQSTSPLHVQGCTFSGLDQDIIFFGNGSLEVADCRFRGCRSGGLSVAVVEARKAILRDCSFGGANMGVTVQHSSASFDSCSFEGMRNAVCAAEDGAAAISACRFVGCEHAIAAGAGAKVIVKDTACMDCTFSLEIAGAPTVRALRVTISGGGTAVSVCQRGTIPMHVSLADCVVTGASKDAVLLHGVGVSGTIEGCRLEGCNVGVLVQSGASVRVADTRLSRCKMGLEVGLPDHVLQLKCDVCGRAGVPAKARAWRQLRAAGEAGIVGARCVHEGALALATLEDVSVADCEAGLKVSGAGRVTARRVDVRGAVVACDVVHIGEPCAFEECTVTGGGDEALSVRRMHGPEHGYEIGPDPVPGFFVREEPGPESGAFAE